MISLLAALNHDAFNKFGTVEGNAENKQDVSTSGVPAPGMFKSSSDSPLICSYVSANQEIEEERSTSNSLVLLCCKAKQMK